MYLFMRNMLIWSLYNLEIQQIPLFLKNLEANNSYQDW